MRQFAEFRIIEIDLKTFTERLLLWSSGYDDVCFLDSNSGTNKYISSNDLIAGVGSISTIKNISSANSFNRLKTFHDSKKDWLFGHLGYDLKNELENLCSDNFDGIQFPDIYFFQPRYVFILSGDKIKIGYLPEVDNEKSVATIFDEILNFIEPPNKDHDSCSILSRITKSEYIENVKKIKDHITRGDIYETNFCQEFHADNAQIDPVQTYFSLNEISQTPFSAFYKQDDKYLMCASPERFLKKTGNKLLSQPIKGTIKRGNSLKKDEILKQELFTNEKERNENVMIVDLVRNDLSRCAASGTVKVDELFGTYTFKQVHQMISTVSCELRSDLHFTEAIRTTFPMGSMTGAPKIKAMQLAEQYESTKRGLYSGALGYITPEGDFDLNVVIRSILYNQTNKYLSFMVGSAITAQSDPNKEYEECLLKAKAMFQVLSQKRGKSKFKRKKVFVTEK